MSLKKEKLTNNDQREESLLSISPFFALCKDSLSPLSEYSQWKNYEKREYGLKPIQCCPSEEKMFISNFNNICHPAVEYEAFSPSFRTPSYNNTKGPILAVNDNMIYAHCFDTENNNNSNNNNNNNTKQQKSYRDKNILDSVLLEDAQNSLKDDQKSKINIYDEIKMEEQIIEEPCTFKGEDFPLKLEYISPTSKATPSFGPTEENSNLFIASTQSSYFHIKTPLQPTQFIISKGIRSPISEEAFKRSDSENDVGCNCKKSKCLKLYCECFANKRFCRKNCKCTDCTNITDSAARTNAIKTLLNRNPDAFSEKITTKPLFLTQMNIQTPFLSSLHKRGCNCKKSGCKKKYCECYGAGVKCTKICKCEECKNNKECGSHSKSDDLEEEVLSRTNVKKLKLSDDEFEENNPTLKKGMKYERQTDTVKKLSIKKLSNSSSFTESLDADEQDGRKNNDGKTSSTVKMLRFVKSEKGSVEKREFMEI